MGAGQSKQLRSNSTVQRSFPIAGSIRTSKDIISEPVVEGEPEADRRLLASQLHLPSVLPPSTKKMPAKSQAKSQAKSGTASTVPARTKKLTGQLKREASQEIGEEPPAKINKLTGRPIRQSAGRKLIQEGFLNTVDAVEKSEGETSEEDVEGRYHRPKRRPRSPTPPDLSPVLATQDSEGLSDLAPLQLPSSASTKTELALTFHVPSGHQGAFIVKLDLESILAGTSNLTGSSSHNSTGILKVSTPQSTKSSRRSRAVANKITLHSKKVTQKSKTGFMDLPGELKNVIYRLVFVDEKPFDFYAPNNFAHSAALLRTCRTINEEGTQILYSENKFILERQNRVRANYWNPQWTEVGFKDIRMWLSSIGALNISHLREVFLICEDALPSGNPKLVSPEERRYVHDENLVQCLKLLAQYGQLKKFSLSLHGRRTLQKCDVRFMDHLKAIQADEIKFDTHPRAFVGAWRYHGRKNLIDYGLEDFLITKMKRNHKLYK